MELNNSLKRVRIGEQEKIPYFIDPDLWVLLIYKNGEWDACSLKDSSLLNELKKEEIKTVLIIWHGNYRTNLFLVDNKYLIRKIEERK